MILISEQIQAIIDGAPEGFTIYRNSRLYKKESKGWLSVKLDGTGKTNKLMPNSGNIHHLTDLREILTLRQRVQELEQQKEHLKSPTPNCSTRFICINCGDGGGSGRDSRPPQSYNCTHCGSKNTMLPKHVYDAVKIKQSEMMDRVVEKAIIDSVLHFGKDNTTASSVMIWAKEYANQLRENEL